MKEKQKRSPRVVIAFVLASIMILITVSVLALFVAFFVVPNRAEERGLDSWRENYRWDAFFEHSYGEKDKAAFLAVHAPSDGDYYYSARSTWFNADGATVLLCWLTYDDPDVYAAAKQSRLHYVAAYRNSLHSAEAFGFSFCCHRTPTDAMQHSTKNSNTRRSDTTTRHGRWSSWASTPTATKSAHTQRWRTPITRRFSPTITANGSIGKPASGSTCPNDPSERRLPPL